MAKEIANTKIMKNKNFQDIQLLLVLFLNL